MTFVEMERALLAAVQRIDRLEARVYGVPVTEAVTVSPSDPRAEPGPRDSQPVARVRPRRPSAPAVAAVVEASSHLDTIARATERLREGLPVVSRGLFHDDGESEQ